MPEWHLHLASVDAPLAQRMGAEMAMSLADLVRVGELRRLKTCAADDCDAVLIDLSRNRSRIFVTPETAVIASTLPRIASVVRRRSRGGLIVDRGSRQWLPPLSVDLCRGLVAARSSTRTQVHGPPNRGRTPGSGAIVR